MKRIALLVTFLSLSGCGTTSAAEGCNSDDDCGDLVCENGSCICDGDDRCKDGHYCNPFGTCQIRPACLSNIDCGATEICNSADPTGGKCIPASQCGSSVHCEFNNYCKPGTATTPSICTAGCRSTGDCQLGYVCAAGTCMAGGTAGDCTVCPASPAPDASYCDYGELCTAQGQCVTHTDANGLCDKPCDDTSCDSSLTCLVDDLGGSYCAPSCLFDRDCPSGYEGCGGLSIVSGPCDSLGGAGPCECTNTGTCPNGGKCVGGGEGIRAYCECVSQEDCNFLVGACFFGSCMTGGGGSCLTDQDCACDGGRCAVGAFPCNTGADCNISCVQFPFGDTTYGRCLTDAKACGKGEGIACDQLTNPALSECRGI